MLYAFLPLWLTIATSTESLPRIHRWSHFLFLWHRLHMNREFGALSIRAECSYQWEEIWYRINCLVVWFNYWPFLGICVCVFVSHFIQEVLSLSLLICAFDGLWNLPELLCPPSHSLTASPTQTEHELESNLPQTFQTRSLSNSAVCLKSCTDAA